MNRILNMKNINNLPEGLGIESKEDELKGKIEELKEERGEIVREKIESKPELSMTEIFSRDLTMVEDKIREMKEALAEFKLRGGTNVIEQNR